MLLVILFLLSSYFSALVTLHPPAAATQRVRVIWPQYSLQTVKVLINDGARKVSIMVYYQGPH